MHDYKFWHDVYHAGIKVQFMDDFSYPFLQIQKNLWMQNSGSVGMHSRKTRPKLPILDGIMDAVSNGLIPAW